MTIATLREGEHVSSSLRATKGDAIQEESAVQHAADVTDEPVLLI